MQFKNKGQAEILITGSSADAEVLALVNEEGKANRYTNQDEEDQDLNTIGDRVEYVEKGV